MGWLVPEASELDLGLNGAYNAANYRQNRS